MRARLADGSHEQSSQLIGAELDEPRGGLLAPRGVEQRRGGRAGGGRGGAARSSSKQPRESSTSTERAPSPRERK